MFLRFNRGQIWIETVVYTLIGLALIGIVLAILTPKIKDFRDRAVIEQSIDSLNVLDSKINELLDAPGNKRKIELTIDKGKFIVNSLNDSVYFVIDQSSTRYSEPNVSLQIGRINITTEELNEKYKVTLEVNYRYNITFEGTDSIENKEFTPVSLPYKFFVENRGIVNSRVQIDVTESS